MDEWATRLIEQAGPVGAAFGVVIIAAGGAIAWAKGLFGKLSSGSKSEPVSNGKPDGNDEVVAALREINQQLSSFDRRIDALERDISSRPSDRDFHELEKAIAVMANTIEHFGGKIAATGEAVTRIEDFLLSLSKGKN
jgi:hypothetical protein